MGHVCGMIRDDDDNDGTNNPVVLFLSSNRIASAHDAFPLERLGRLRRRVLSNGRHHAGGSQCNGRYGTGLSSRIHPPY